MSFLHKTDPLYNGGKRNNKAPAGRNDERTGVDMMENKNGFATTAIHAGKMKDAFGALNVPIYQTSTYAFDSCEQGGAVFAGEEQRFAYSRIGCPTNAVLEAKLAALEGGEAALATSSGMGAITSLLWSLVSAGDHIVADTTLYGCTYEFLAHHMPRFGVQVDFIDTSDLDAVRASLREQTKVVYLETPANPNLKVVDLKAVAEVAHAFCPDIRVVCDNTFASPYLQTPLALGVDLVVHSATKYLNGHGDLLAGFVVGRAEDVMAARMVGLKDMTGSVMAANEAFLVIRGLKTLAVRMKQHCTSAMQVAQFLQGHPKVTRVYYPGLPDHPGHDIACRQMHRGFGGMLSFEVAGGRAAGAKLLNGLGLCTIAVSLGDAETLIEHPASMTHAPYSAEELAASGIPEGLVRLSVGLEEPEDIIADLEQSLAKL